MSSDRPQYRYFYLVYETGNKSFIVRRKAIPMADLEIYREVFYKFSDYVIELMNKGYTAQEVSKKIKYIAEFDIKTHRQEIQKGWVQDINIEDMFRDFGMEYSIYFITSIRKKIDFSEVFRHDESRHVEYITTLGDSKRPSIIELFLN